jgi:hypothetical protein
MIQGGVGDSDDSSQPEESLFVDFVAAYQILVIAKISQEPAESTQSLLGAIEAAREEAALILMWFEDGEAQNVEGSLRMPAEEDAINSDKKSTLQCVIPLRLFSMKTGDLAFHDTTSSDLV